MNKPRSRRRIFALLILLSLCLGGVVVNMSVTHGSISAALSRLFGNDAAGGGKSSDQGGSSSAGSQQSGLGAADGNGGATGSTGFVLDPHALPLGLTSIDGEGGTGVDRAVKKSGVWYPVYSPGLAKKGGAPPLTVIPLTIASGPAPAGKVGIAYKYQAEAIGGTPPYQWSAVLSSLTDQFTFDQTTALLSGTSLQPATATLSMVVKDGEGTIATAQMLLKILPEKDLEISTATLAPGMVGEDYSQVMEAAGGVPPYRWSVQGTLPEGLSLSPDSGIISGVPIMGESVDVKFLVKDSQDQTAERNVIISASEGLEITTEDPLPPAAPGSQVQQAFQATGGVSPLSWEMVESTFPDDSWQLSPEGVLTGNAPMQEQIISFTLRVLDASEATFEKTFHLAVSDLLLAIPSAEKVGLAWSPKAINAMLAKSGAAAAASFAIERDGMMIYQGQGTNMVDHNLVTGSSPSYTLVVFTSDGSQLPVATKSVTILPMTLKRAEPGKSADPYADRVTSFQPLTAGGYGFSQIPSNVTGPPDGKSTYSPASKPAEIASLHAKDGAGGLIDLEFSDNIVELGPGEDLTVFENVLFVGGDGNQRFMEPAVVSVALFPGEWHRLPTDVLPSADGVVPNVMNPFYYAKGIAGRNGTTGEDPTNPSKSGGDSFDLNGISSAGGLSWIRFIRIQSTGDNWMRDDNGGELIRHNADPAFRPLTGLGTSGFDLDAVSAVHY